MDRDTVVRLAKEAGDIYSFATLIANETLERAAKVCEESGASKYGCFCSDAIRALKE